ncbi:MAG: hypothetical protein Q4E88_02835 [Coriobacteriia bacterium]|nr:hypothetical protein [Coriobacteriia bacterium]
MISTPLTRKQRELDEVLNVVTEVYVMLKERQRQYEVVKKPDSLINLAVFKLGNILRNSYNKGDINDKKNMH